MLSAFEKEQLSRISSDMEVESPDQEDNWLVVNMLLHVLLSIQLMFCNVKSP